LPAKVWINQPRPKIETEEAPKTLRAIHIGAVE
jgi:hypothetical protein